MALKTFNTGDKLVGTAEYMQAQVTLDDGGGLLVRTHTFTHMALYGFTGGMVAILSDKDGKVVWQSPAKQYGVDGTAFGWLGKQSDRTVDEHFQVGPDIAAATDRIDVVLTPSPHNRFADDVNALVNLGGVIMGVIQKIADATKTDNPPNQPGSPPPFFNDAFVANLYLPNGGPPPPPPRTLLARVTPEDIPFNTPTMIRVDATDQATSAPITGQVWASLVVATIGTAGGRLLGNTGGDIVGSLHGSWVATPQSRPGHLDFRWVQEHIFVVAAGYHNTTVTYEMTNLPPEPGKHPQPVP